MPNLNRPLTLRSKLTIPNRLAKAAMRKILPIKISTITSYSALYESFGASGAGLLITGNILVDHHALGEPNNVALEEDTL